MNWLKYIWTVIIVKISMFLMYYCLLSAIAYNFLYDLIRSDTFLIRYDKAIMMVISIVLSYLLNKSVVQRGKEVNNNLIIKTPGQRI